MADPSDSGSSTPAGRFTSQGYTAEDILKQQTVGLVNLSDFRKRRAEAIEQTERGSSRDGTPGAEASSDGRESATKTATTAFKKRKKGVKKGGLSFGTEAEEEEEGTGSIASTTQPEEISTAANDGEVSEVAPKLKKKGLRPNSTVGFQPKALTKAAVLRDAQLKEQLRKEYIALQDAVKATDFCLPFVFFDGKNAPGGVCRMKKGDFIWLFLERARKLGAGMAHKSRRDWARIGVDDLMVVRGDLIIPHHYDFHYFILNRSTGYNGKTIFSYATEPTAATPEDMLPAAKADAASESTPPPVSTQNEQAGERTSKYLQTASDRAAAAPAAQPPAIPDSELEGYNDEPSLTKVVDRRWYEKNKHIFPASLWEEFDANKDYSQGPRTDGQGNAFFFSRR